MSTNPNRCNFTPSGITNKTDRSILEWKRDYIDCQCVIGDLDGDGVQMDCWRHRDDIKKCRARHRVKQYGLMDDLRYLWSKVDWLIWDLKMLFRK